MASMMISIEGIPVPRHARSTPKLLVRGRRRRALRKAINALKVLANQDDAENRRSSAHNYTPYLILGSGNSAQSRAHGVLLEKMTQSMSAKA